MTELMISAAHKMLVVPQSTAVGNMFPHAKLVDLKGLPFHLVPHQPAECFLLRTMGYTVPAPILTHYKWPGAFKPFEAQYQAAAANKVFAVSSHGGWGLAVGKPSLEDALEGALSDCESRRPPYTPECRPVNVNGQWGRFEEQ